MFEICRTENDSVMADVGDEAAYVMTDFWKTIDTV